MTFSPFDFSDIGSLNCMNAAMRYADRGVHVFPGRTSGDTKTPGVKHWKDDASADRDAVLSLWASRPTANVLARTGPQSGLFVLDVDVKPKERVNGFKTLAELEKKHGPLPDTVRQLTGSGEGGTQFFFKWPAVPEGYKLSITQGVDAKGNQLHGIDTRGDTGYVVLPPSVHPETGGVYQWHDACGPLADLPDWLLQMFLRPIKAPKADATARPQFEAAPSDYAAKAMQEEMARLYAAPEGQRNGTLNRVAFSLGQLATALPADTPERLYSAGIGIGLEDDETRRTIRSGWEAGLKEPRQVPNATKPARLDVAPLKLINPADWANVEPKAREYSLHGWMPLEQCTLLTGAGSGGKSLFGQQLCVSMATGEPFLGMQTEQMNTLYITCEDSANELHLRQKAICKRLGVDIEYLSDRMHLLSLLGELNNELGTYDKERRFSLAPRFEQIRAVALENDIRFIVLDNASHFYAGNENARNEVAAFTNALNRLAGELNGSVLLVAHPNKAGDEYSGSTAWENQVRARLFLGMVEDEAGNVIDADLRVLRRSKSNYDKRGTEVQFRWHEWAYVIPSDLPGDEYKKYQEGMQLITENTRFLECLKKLTVQKINVSHSPQAANYAPKKMARMPMAAGMQRPQFARAMERLLDCGSITAQSKVFENEKRQAVLGLVINETAEDDLGVENDLE